MKHLSLAGILVQAIAFFFFLSVVVRDSMDHGMDESFFWNDQLAVGYADHACSKPVFVGA